MGACLSVVVVCHNHPNDREAFEGTANMLKDRTVKGIGEVDFCVLLSDAYDSEEKWLNHLCNVSNKFLLFWYIGHGQDGTMFLKNFTVTAKQLYEKVKDSRYMSMVLDSCQNESTYPRPQHCPYRGVEFNSSGGLVDDGIAVSADHGQSMLMVNLMQMVMESTCLDRRTVLTTYIALNVKPSADYKNWKHMMHAIIAGVNDTNKFYKQLDHPAMVKMWSLK